MSLFPDYGTPGAPNLDPYYRSPEQVEADTLLAATAECDLQSAIDEALDAARKFLTAQACADVLRETADRTWRAVG